MPSEQHDFVEDGCYFLGIGGESGVYFDDPDGGVDG